MLGKCRSLTSPNLNIVSTFLLPFTWLFARRPALRSSKSLPLRYSHRRIASLRSASRCRSLVYEVTPLVHLALIARHPSLEPALARLPALAVATNFPLYQRVALSLPLPSPAVHRSLEAAHFGMPTAC